MNGIETIIQRLNTNARADTDALLDKARQEAAAITARYQAQADQEAANLAACLPMALGGLFSAIAQGRVAAASINILAKKPDDWSKGMVLCITVEFYAILALLASMLMIINISA